MQTGEVVSAAQEDTLDEPRGVIFGVGGSVLISDGDGSVREVTYGRPEVTAITPGVEKW